MMRGFAPTLHSRHIYILTMKCNKTSFLLSCDSSVCNSRNKCVYNVNMLYSALWLPREGVKYVGNSVKLLLRP